MTPHIVFDVGGVLLEWHPHQGYIDVFDSAAETQAFLDRTDFRARNIRADRGERFADLAQELDDPRDRALFASYVSRFSKMVQNKVPGSWDILNRLQARGACLYAITNWSAETWVEAQKAHPSLATTFRTTIVSGHEGVLKPDPRLFQLLFESAGVAPVDCVFIDDSLINVESAGRLGMDAIHFETADKLAGALLERELL